MLNCSFCEHDHAEKDENSFNSAFWTCEFTDAYGKIKKPVSIAVFLLHTPPVFHSRRLPAKVLSSIFTNSQTLSCHGRTQSFFKSMQAPRTLNIWWQGNPQLKYSFCWPNSLHFPPPTPKLSSTSFKWWPQFLLLRVGTASKGYMCDTILAFSASILSPHSYCSGQPRSTLYLHSHSLLILLPHPSL